MTIVWWEIVCQYKESFHKVVFIKTRLKYKTARYSIKRDIIYLFNRKAIPKSVITYLLSGALGVSGFVILINCSFFNGFK